ncbi:ferredoxin--NADP reductase [Aldersonia sp. NBC_00410]|uniref:ferredoxin--NADP reductase n=1 Tax=Aldersonia sp. NBC_00410 TaxID=2975954 RepID=UPI002254B7F8|nr:ferredoxin--NADP reductase [Aldersonia sp. NBC_00410]MCX5044738.1 ferredoxin--NADP reductase [Aldersonia sp. NBC_00410]
MPESSPSSPAVAAVPDGFVPLLVTDVIRETPDAVSVEFEVPPASRQRFRYSAGQFLTLSILIDGTEYRRCYSMSSTPSVGENLRVTVKRDRDGRVSNWINDNVTPGDRVHAAPPQGRFVLDASDREFVAFAGGSGITPVFSLLRSVLGKTTRSARLFYANRAESSVIFADALGSLSDRHAGRFELRHHLDETHGVANPESIESFLAGAAECEFYICGPAPFMATVEAALLAAGVQSERIHVERFASTVPELTAQDEAATVTEEVTIELDRKKVTLPYRAGYTLMQMARSADMRPPSSCETGTCGTCIAQVTEGAARLLNNDVLDDDEIAEGYVVTCQALPTTRTVRVVYE